MDNRKCESSAEIRKRVCAARAIQRQRFKDLPFKSNAEMSSECAKKFAGMSPEVERFAVSAADRMNLSARGFYRMLKVSRTIADMRKAPNVEVVDISEALRYRTIN